jgi:hypothetical protein
MLRYRMDVCSQANVQQITASKIRIVETVRSPNTGRSSPHWRSQQSPPRANPYRGSVVAATTPAYASDSERTDSPSAPLMTRLSSPSAMTRSMPSSPEMPCSTWRYWAAIPTRPPTASWQQWPGRPVSRWLLVIRSRPAAIGHEAVDAANGPVPASGRGCPEPSTAPPQPHGAGRCRAAGRPSAGNSSESAADFTG